MYAHANALHKFLLSLYYVPSPVPDSEDTGESDGGNDPTWKGWGFLKS